MPCRILIEDYDSVRKQYNGSTGSQGAAALGEVGLLAKMYKQAVAEKGKDAAIKIFTTPRFHAKNPKSVVTLVAQLLFVKIDLLDFRKSTQYYLCLLWMLSLFKDKILSEKAVMKVLKLHDQARQLFFQYATAKDKKDFIECVSSKVQGEEYFHHCRYLIKHLDIKKLEALVDDFLSLSDTAKAVMKKLALETNLIGDLLTWYQKQLVVEQGEPNRHGDKISKALFLLVRSFGVPAEGLEDGEKKIHHKTSAYQHAINRAKRAYELVVLRKACSSNDDSASSVSRLSR